MTGSNAARHMDWRTAFLVFAAALLLRLALLPLAELDTGDTAARIWLGWQWADDPFLITRELWGPLHFYLIGAVLSIWPDPVWAPLALHVVLGSFVAVIAYQLTLELFGERRAALAAGLIFAVYPAALAVSLGARAETPFMFFLGLAMIGLVRAWRPDGRLSHAAFAGIAATLASALRYEAWLLLPFLVLVLLIGRKPKHAAVFLAIAMIHPLIWMTGHAIAFGNPLHSLMTTATWLEDVMGRAPDTSLLPGIGRIIRLVGRTAAEMTIPVSLLLAAGIVRCLRQKRLESVWLIPPVGLLLIFAISLFRNTMIPKSGYTTTFGLLLIPFIACALEWMGVARWSRARGLASALVLFVVMATFMVPPVTRRLPASSWLDANPVPSIPDEASMRELQSLIERAGLRREQDGLISDFFGHLPTPYVAWQTRLHPNQICRAPGGQNVPLTAEQIEIFLTNNRSGVIVTLPGGRIADQLKLGADGSGTLAGIPVRLDPVGKLDWVSKDRDSQFGTLSVARYEVVGGDKIAARPRLTCTAACSTSFCREASS